jgi:hypothetical protein
MWRFLRQDAHPNCCFPLHASPVSIARLNRGQPMDPVTEPVLVRISAGHEPPGDFMERPFVVVTDRMRAALERTGIDNVQYFRARVQPEWSEQIEQGYWLMNVIGVVTCVDRLASGLDIDDDTALSDIASFVIDPDRTCGLGIFRLAEDVRMIVVSPRVQVALRAAGLRGVLFQDASAYDGGRAISMAQLERLRGDGLDQ